VLRYIVIRLVIVIKRDRSWLAYREKEGNLSRYIYKDKVTNALYIYYNIYRYFSEKIIYYKTIKRFY